MLRCQTNDFHFHLKELKKEEQIKPTENRRKETMKIRVKIYDQENIDKQQRNSTKADFLR